MNFYGPNGYHGNRKQKKSYHILIQQHLLSLFSKFDEYPYEACHVYRKMPILRAKMVAMETFAHKMVIISVINGPKLAHGESFM